MDRTKKKSKFKEFINDIFSRFNNHKIINSILLILMLICSILISIHLTLDSHHEAYDIVSNYVGFTDKRDNSEYIKDKYSYIHIKEFRSDGSDILKPKRVITAYDNDEFIKYNIKLKENNNNLEIKSGIFYLDDIALDALVKKGAKVIVNNEAKSLTKSMDIVGVRLLGTPYICGGMFNSLPDFSDIHFIASTFDAYSGEEVRNYVTICGGDLDYAGPYLGPRDVFIKESHNELIYYLNYDGSHKILDNRDNKDYSNDLLSKGECLISLMLFNVDKKLFDPDMVYDDSNPSEIPLNDLKIPNYLYADDKNGDVHKFKIKGIVLNDDTKSLYFSHFDTSMVMKSMVEKPSFNVYVKTNTIKDDIAMDDFHYKLKDAISGVRVVDKDIFNRYDSFIHSDSIYIIRGVLFALLLTSILGFLLINTYLDEDESKKSNLNRLASSFKLLLVFIIISVLISIAASAIALSIIKGSLLMGYNVIYYTYEEFLRELYFMLIALGFIVVSYAILDQILNFRYE